MNYIETKLEPNGALLTGFTYAPSVTLPESQAKPAVLVIPGGAYMHCVDKEADPVAMAYLARGFNAFVLRYSCTGGITPGCPVKSEEEVFDCALADAQSAIRYLRENAGTLHIDPDRIAAVGFSAGANLTASLNLLTQDRANAMVLCYGAYDDVLGIRSVKTRPLYPHIDRTAPPAFLFATGPDATVACENTLRMTLALHEAGVPVESHLFVSGDHGLALATHATGDENPDAAQWLEMSVRFLGHVWSGENLLWGGLDQKRPGLDTRCDILAAHPGARAAIEAEFPEQAGMLTANPFFSYISFRRFADMMHLDPAGVSRVEEALKHLR